MVNFITTIEDIVTSADLPDRFEFSMTGPSALVYVMVEHMQIFMTHLFPYNGTTTLYDLRSIVVDYLRSNGSPMAMFAVWVNEEGSEDTAKSNYFHVVYSDISIADTTDFLTHHFLTTRSSFRISRQGQQVLSWFAAEGDTIQGFIDAVSITADGNTAVTRINEGSEEISAHSIWTKTIRVEEVAEQTPDKLVAFTVHRGSRSITFYVTEEVPDITLSFRNAFNAMESAEIYAVTTTKQKVERSEAHILRARSFYDQTTETTFEVVTAALPYEEAIWLQQLFASYLVTKGGREILITESESEISDEDSEQNRAKFTWKYAKQTQILHAPYELEVFSDQFKDQFT